MLFMKKQFFDAIRSGRKTATLRFWARRQVRPETTHLVRGLGQVRILAVEPISLADLTDRDARVDGFDDLAQLHRALEEVYPPEARAGKQLYKVTFRYPAEAETTSVSQSPPS
jgi:hypothetical protein